MALLNYWGDIDSSKSSLRTNDNIAITEILEDLNQDMVFYDDMKTKFVEALAEPIAVPERVMNRYSSVPVIYAEGSRPANIGKADQFVQQIPFVEYQDNLTLTTRAIQMMSAEQVAAYVNAKMTGFEALRFSDFRKSAFTNTDRLVLDSFGQYKTLSRPFYNGSGLGDLIPVAGYSFQAGDDQHYNGVATPGGITSQEVRTLLIDKVRHHGYSQVELHENEFDYYLEALGLGIFTPAAEQIGSNTQLNSGASIAGTSESLYNGLVGYVYNSPVVKSRMVPRGYIMAVGISNQAGMKPFFSRQHPLGLSGLQLDVTVQKNPLESTMMSDGWGFASNNRGGCAFVKITGSSYTIPTDL